MFSVSAVAGWVDCVDREQMLLSVSPTPPPPPPSQSAFIHYGTATEYLYHMCHSSFMKEASLFSHEAEVKYVGMMPPGSQGDPLLMLICTYIAAAYTNYCMSSNSCRVYGVPISLIVSYLQICLHYLYCMAGNFGKEFILADWRF